MWSEVELHLDFVVIIIMYFHELQLHIPASAGCYDCNTYCAVCAIGYFFLSFPTLASATSLMPTLDLWIFFIFLLTTYFSVLSSV
jgi:hypothetical protein